MTRLVILLFLLLVANILYFHFGGRFLGFFAPQPFVLASALIGAFFGRRPGMLSGFFLGLIEELCFVSSLGSLGPTPFVYLWCGFLAGVFFYDRFDLDNILAGFVISGSSLLFSYLLAALWFALFHQWPVFWPGFDSRLLVSFLVQGLFLGPLLFKVFIRHVH